MTWRFALLFLTMVLLPVSALAQIKLKTIDDVVSVYLIEGWRDSDGTHLTAVSFDMAPGWRTYWRAPGDGGLPTSISWRGSRNLAAAQKLWPRPQVFRTFGLRSIGYSDRLVLPIRLTPRTSGPIRVKADISFGICQEICLPARVKLSAVLADRSVPRSADIQSALQDRPMSATQAALRQSTCRFEPGEDGIRINVSLVLPKLAGKGEAVVIEPGDASYWVSEPVARRQGQVLEASALMVPQTPGGSIDRDKMRITVLSTQTAVDIRGCRAPG
ncbi:MAG: protein-disulfide reductase DsbD domain-containing protein [Pseudomonadota bacterium]